MKTLKNNKEIVEHEIKKNIFNKVRYGKYIDILNKYIAEHAEKITGTPEEEEYRKYYMVATRWK